MRPLTSSLHRRRSQRGVTLIEGMAAAVIFAVGVVGAFAGIMMASGQNTSANRLAVAHGIARQVRYGLESQGYRNLTQGTGLLTSARCTTDSNVRDGLTGGLGQLTSQSCVIDLDAFEDASSPENDIVPAYSPELRAGYRRVLVWQQDPQTNIASVLIVVSFGDTLGRRFVRHSAALYNPSNNQARVNL
jgi:type II secretory pathway pseudopilin PulG